MTTSEPTTGNIAKALRVCFEKKCACSECPFEHESCGDLEQLAADRLESREQTIAAWNRRSDAVPVVRGEWIAEQKGAEYCEFRCSSCDGSIGQTDQFDETEVKQFSEWYKCCPMCGAMMRGEA